MTDRAARLKALRREMHLFEMDGFIIPRADEHQGEYVAPCSERLSWISGFTGSAGMAIVLSEKAAVFVDGRYTLQVDQQVDHGLFDRCPMADTPAEDWIADHLKPGQKLAYDPWLHTGAGLHRIKTACEKVGAKLVAAPHNFIDAIWVDRPAPPMDNVRIHPLDYAGKSHLEKIATLGESLREDGQFAMVLTLPDSIAWLLNIRGSDIPCTPVALGFALLYADETVDLFMAPEKITDEVRTHLGDKVRIHAPDALSKCLKELGKAQKTVLVDKNSVPEWVRKTLKKAGAEIVPGDDLTILPKACKNEVEAEGMRNAHRRDGAHMVTFLHWLSKQPFDPKTNEETVARFLDQQRASDKLFVDYSFPTISGAGPNGAIVHYRHHVKTARALPENGLYLVDSGAQYLDGTTDITRTIVRGTPTDEMKDRFTRVLKGHIALAMACFPKGTSGSQLDILARHALWQGGYDYDHGTGHGVGSFLSVHEGPQRISKMPSRQALMPGMVVSNEPGYYKTDAYGIRLENLVMVVENKDVTERPLLKFETITLCPFDIKGINLAMLTEDEKDWLNTYHQRVCDELTPLLPREDAAWLAVATRPV